MSEKVIGKIIATVYEDDLEVEVEGQVGVMDAVGVKNLIDEAIQEAVDEAFQAKVGNEDANH